MDAKVEIFDIGRKDLRELTRLARDYFTELEIFDRGLRMAPNWDKEYYDMMELGLQARPFFMRGARTKGKTVGFVMFSYRVEQMWSLAARGYISNIYVVPDHRRKGIGRKLLADAIARLKVAGAQSVEMEVYAANALGIAFWEKMGFASFKERRRLLLPE